MTVLGEFVLPQGGQAWTQSLVAALELLGVKDKAARQALARMQTRGWLDRERIGRRTRWTLTAHGVELLTEGAKRIYSFGSQAREWDGRWVVLLASVPERDRAVRYRMAQGLGWAGFGSVGQGVWLSPWTDHEPMAVDLLTELAVQATSFRAELGGLGDGADLAAMAWDLPALRLEYDAFLAGPGQTPTRGQPGAAVGGQRRSRGSAEGGGVAAVGGLGGSPSSVEGGGVAAVGGLGGSPSSVEGGGVAAVGGIGGSPSSVEGGGVAAVGGLGGSPSSAEDSGAAAVAELSDLVHRWRSFPLLDPELPAELLADDWPGPAAATHFADRRAALLPLARDWWQSQEAANSGH